MRCQCVPRRLGAIFCLPCTFEFLELSGNLLRLRECMNICVCNIANHDLKSSVYLSSQRLPLLKANMQRTPGASQDLLREQIYRLSAGSYFYRRSGQVNGTHTQHKHNLIFKNALPLRRLRFFSAATDIRNCRDISNICSSIRDI